MNLNVHVVSDLHHPLEGVVVFGRAVWATGKRDWAWEGDVPADSCVRAGQLSLPVPPSPGPLRFEFEIDHPMVERHIRVLHTTIV